MKILFVGLIYDYRQEKQILEQSKAGLPVASNLYQWNLIKGIKENNIDITVLSSIPYGNYPKLSKKIITKNLSYAIDNVPVKEMGYINFYFIKHLIRENCLKKNIKKWIKSNLDNDCTIIFYDLYNPFLDIIKWLKNYSCVKSCLVIPDLVGDLRNDVGITGIKNQILNRKARGILTKASYADSFVLLTEQMNSIVNLNKKKYVVVDGIVDENSDYQWNKQDKRVIMYAGALSKQYNIGQLLKEFEECKYSNLELWFCGKGNAEDLIQDAVKRDSRIKYWGFLSKDELKKLEKKVSFYINPRINNGEYTKYSFPSKNLEYLLSGKPVIAYKLSGMSNDYDSIFLYLDEKEQNSMKKMFARISNMSDLEIEKLSRKGVEFVKEHNGRKMQSNKVIALLKGSL